MTTKASRCILLSLIVLMLVGIVCVYAIPLPPAPPPPPIPAQIPVPPAPAPAPAVPVNPNPEPFAPPLPPEPSDTNVQPPVPDKTPNTIPTMPEVNPTSDAGSQVLDFSSSSSDSYSPPQEIVMAQLELPPPPPEEAPPEEAPAQEAPVEPESEKSSSPDTSSSSNDLGAENPPVTPVPTQEPVLDTLRTTAHNSSAMTPAALVFPEASIPAVAVTTGISLAMVSNFFMANIDKLFSLKLFGFVRDYVGEHTLQGLDEYEAKKRKIVVRTGKKTILGLTHSEITVAIIGSLLIGFATVIALRSPISITEILIYVLAGGIAVTLHEFGHRYAARRKNVATEVKFWGLGAVTMFITGWFTGNVFAQPQRTLIDEKMVEEKANDGEKIPVDVQISLAGPLVNLIIAAITVPFLFVGGEVSRIASIMLMMTLLLAVYHLMPFSPMDGKAIMKWNKWVLAAMLIPLIAVYSYLFLL